VPRARANAVWRTWLSDGADGRPVSGRAARRPVDETAVARIGAASRRIGAADIGTPAARRRSAASAASTRCSWTAAGTGQSSVGQHLPRATRFAGQAGVGFLRGSAAYERIEIRTRTTQ